MPHHASPSRAICIVDPNQRLIFFSAFPAQGKLNTYDDCGASDTAANNRKSYNPNNDERTNTATHYDCRR